MPMDPLKKLHVKLLIIILCAAGCVVAFWKMGLRLGLDLSGGTELLYKIRVENLPPEERRDITQRTIDVIRRRVDPRGTEQLDIRPRGKYRFFIQLPRRSDQEAQRVEKRLQQSGNLVFCMVNSNREDLDKALQGTPIPRHTPFIRRQMPDEKGKRVRERHYKVTYKQIQEEKPGPNDWMLVENKPIVTGQWLARVYPSHDDMGMPAVGFEFRGKGRRLFTEATEQNVNRRMAIILDDILYSAPVIRSRIAGPGVIEGRFSKVELDDLITTLQAGSLPADIELEWKHVIGPSLGLDSIRQGKNAMIFSLGMVVIFMAGYYLVAGAVADLAVFLNVVFMVGSMVLLNVVLTLPGLAGIVLTVGMAVDANVLIYERIREELARGKGLRLAIASGYQGALATIVDSNLTTLITAFILFGVGTGPVRGFAVALSLGIIWSMFTQLVVTRLLFDTMVEHGVLRRLMMFQLFRRPNLAFSRIRYISIGASVTLIIIGLAVFYLRGDDKYDTDLTGGIMADIEMGQGLAIDQFRGRVRKIFAQADVQSVWEAEMQSGALPRRFAVRIKQLPEAEQVEKMRSDLEAAIVGAGLAERGCVRHDKEWTFETLLKQTADESHLRAVLDAAGYRRSDIKGLLAKTAKSENFLIWLREDRADESRERGVADVLKAIGDLVVTRSLAVENVGQIQHEQEESDAPRERAAARARWRLDVTLRDVAHSSAIREAIIAQALRGERKPFIVANRDPKAGGDLMREVRLVSADEAVLERIKAAFPDKLAVASFSQARGSEMTVALQSKQGESDLWSRFHQADLGDLVQAVLPQGVGDTQYVATMNPLREDKVLDKVREDLCREFKAEVAADVYRVEFIPAQPPSFVPEREASGQQFFTLKLDRACTVQMIASKLGHAGLRDALALETELRLIASEKRVEAVIRLGGTPEEVQKRQQDIRDAFATSDPFRRIENVGKVVAGEMRNRAFLATLLSMIAIVLYLWMRFGELKYGVAAVVALIHDVLMTAGAVAVADALTGTFIGNLLGFSDIKINLDMIAAFLTIVGYSVNDTIVVFSRIRENLAGARRRVDPAMVDNSVNQTLSRTTLTSLTTLFVTVVLYIMGGPVIHGFAFALSFGIVVGTYSSVFIAAPLLIDWERGIEGVKKAFRVATFRRG